MSNLINFREKTCQCSNGCTDVLLTVIGLSGSRLARTDDERNMMVWLMMKDQNIVGRGTVGFDITEMLWEKEYFERQKQFMLRVLDNFNIFISISRQTNYNNVFISISPLNRCKIYFRSARKMFCPIFYFSFQAILMFLHNISNKTPTPMMTIFRIFFIGFCNCCFVFFIKIFQRIKCLSFFKY